MLHNEEDKKQKYGFDFASDNSPPNLIFIDPSLKNNAVKETPEEKSPLNNFFSYDINSLKKALREQHKNPFPKRK
jgi:hypothetical protein